MVAVVKNDPTDLIFEQYFQNRYLRNATDSELEHRMADLANMAASADHRAMIVLSSRYEAFPKITQCQAELCFRHGHYAAKFSGTPFKDILPFDEPRRQRIIVAAKSFKSAPKKSLFRFGKEAHMRSLFEKGELLVQPATRFLKEEAKAVQDNECYLEVLGTLTADEMRSLVSNPEDLPPDPQEYPIKISFETDNYGLFCYAKNPELRMISDWDATAVVIIRNPAEFEKRLRRAALKTFTGTNIQIADVTYMDPYFPPRKIPNVMLQKHFRYTYQAERRMVISGAEIGPEGTLLSLGSLADIATFVPLTP